MSFPIQPVIRTTKALDRTTVISNRAIPYNSLSILRDNTRFNSAQIQRENKK